MKIVSLSFGLGIATSMMSLLCLGQDVKLEYHYKAGDQWRVKNTIHQQISGEALRGRTLNIVLESFEKTHVESVDESGIASVVSTQDSVAAKVNDQSLPHHGDETLNGIPIRRKITKTGKCLEASSNKDFPAELERTMNMFKQECQNSAGFPEKELKVGESWNDEQVFSVDLGGITFDYTIKAHYRLLGFEKNAGYDCAVLRITSTLDGTLTLEEGSGTVTGTGRGTRFFAVKEGKEVSQFMDLTATREVITPKGKMQLRIVLNTSEELVK